MSYSVGAAGAFGILLTSEEFQDIVEKMREAHQSAEMSGEEEPNEAIQKFLKPVIELLNGVIVPAGAELHYTGDDDERPGGCATDADEFVLGFGLYTMPWQYGEIHESFRTRACWHTWVWCSH